jgi:hypothetical protein
MKTLLAILTLCTVASAQYVPTYNIVTELPTPTGSGTTYVLASDSTRYVDGPRGWRKLGGHPSSGWAVIGAGGGDMYHADSTTYYMTRSTVKDSLSDIRASIPATSSFVAKADSATMPGYVTRTPFAADTTYKAAQIALRKLNSDTTAGTGYVRNWQINDKGGSYFEIRKGTRVAFAKTDSSGASVDSTVYATVNRMLDSLGDHRTTIDANRAALKSAAYMDSARVATLDKAQTIAGAQTITGNVNGIPYWTTLVRSADTTKGTITFVDLGQLEFNMAASGFYEVEWNLFVVRATAATGLTVAHNFTQAPSNTAMVGTGSNAVAAGTDMLITNTMDTYLDSLQLTGTTVTTGEWVRGEGWILNTGSTTGWKLRWHAENAANVTIKRGSYVSYRRLY